LPTDDLLAKVTLTVAEDVSLRIDPTSTSVKVNVFELVNASEEENVVFFSSLHRLEHTDTVEQTTLSLTIASKFHPAGLTAE